MDPWPPAKQLYRLLNNSRFNHKALLAGLSRIGRRMVLAAGKLYMAVAIRPVIKPSDVYNHLCNTGDYPQLIGVALLPGVKWS